MSELRGKALIPALNAMGLELDQRLYAALAHCDGSGRSDGGITDAQLFIALLNQNSIATRHLASVYDGLVADDHPDYFKAEHRKTVAPENVTLHQPGESSITTRVFEHAISSARDTGTVGTKDFLRSLLEVCFAEGDSYVNRPYTLDLLSKVFGGSQRKILSYQPQLQSLLRDLQTSAVGSEDYQFILAFEEGQIRFRVASTLGSYVQRSDSGSLVPNKAVLTHVDQLGLFTRDSIEELESLLNDPSAREQQFQEFFERYPLFLRKWDHRQVHPQVHLVREELGPLIPDFILTNAAAQDAAIVELKRPDVPIVRREKNRERFNDAVMGAKAQLLKYQRWFEVPANQAMLKNKVGMAIYQPRLMVIIGRSSEFRDEVERATLRSDNPEIEVATYDDILRYARQRQIIIDA